MVPRETLLLLGSQRDLDTTSSHRDTTGASGRLGTIGALGMGRKSRGWKIGGRRPFNRIVGLDGRKLSAYDYRWWRRRGSGG